MTFHLYFGLFTLSALIVLSTAHTDLAIGVRKCLNDPAHTSNPSYIDICMGQLLEDIKPRLTEGIPEIGIPILEPFTLGQFEFTHREGSVNTRASFRNVLVEGFSNFTLISMKTDLKAMTLTTRVFIPRLRVKGLYKLDGNILFVEVVGNGPFRAILSHINAEVSSNIVRKSNPDGTERLGVAKTRTKFALGKARTRLDNLFNGNKVLGDTVNHFINENDQLIIKEIQPQVSNQISKLVESVFENAIATLPVNIGLRDQLPPLSTQ